MSSPIALLLGFSFTLFFKSPLVKYGNKVIQYLLKIAIVGLGFGMLVVETIEAGKSSLLLVFLAIALTLALGYVLGRLFKMDRHLSHLITSGTAICGGSAIATMSAIINAKGQTISIALGIVFLLNSLALLIFPSLGNLLNLTQNQFGMWSAVANNDTSSALGAALTYGDESLEIATTVKLSRTLWIIPLAILTMIFFKTKGGKLTIPYFILLFVGAIALNSFGIVPTEISNTTVLIAKRLLLLALFLVGTTLSIKNIKSIGFKPIAFGALSWLFIAAFSLTYILFRF